MKDATRNEAIAWCKENKADFINSVFPPPNGWAWGEQMQDDVRLTLTAIFTNTVDADINYYDVYGVPVEDKFISISEGWLHDIKAALKDPSRTIVRRECVKYVEAKLKADKLSHCCPEWDMSFISPQDPEWEACCCLIKIDSKAPKMNDAN